MLTFLPKGLSVEEEVEEGEACGGRGEMCGEGHLQQDAVSSTRLSAGGLLCMYKHIVLTGQRNRSYM